MIVIAKNNGKIYLERLLNSISDLGINEKILIVDTGSTDDNHLNYLKELENLENITVTQTPYKCYDTGAYMWAYNNFVEDNYHFMHDSIKLKDSEFINNCNSLLNNYDVVSYISFEFVGYGDEDWKQFFLKNAKTYEHKFGIFGPMFSIKRKTLDKLPIKNLTLPINKNQQTAMESIWPTFFLEHKLSIYSMELYNHYRLINDMYSHFEKTLLIRK